MIFVFDITELKYSYFIDELKEVVFMFPRI